MCMGVCKERGGKEEPLILDLSIRICGKILKGSFFVKICVHQIMKEKFDSNVVKYNFLKDTILL